MNPAEWSANVWIGIGCCLFLGLFVSLTWALKRAYEAGRYDCQTAISDDSESRG